MPKRTRQVAALPWRDGEHGLEILLVTTRRTKRWVIPKGWTMDGKADHEAAEIEAYEEAGLRGVMDSTHVGNYNYEKRMRSGAARKLMVQVYAMEVTEILEEWPEREERQRQWIDQRRALDIVGESELLPILATFKGRTSSLPEKLKIWWRRLMT